MQVLLACCVALLAVASVTGKGEYPLLGRKHSPHGGGGKPPGSPTQPWNYVLAYSWTPGFCKGTTYPGCSTPQPYWTNHFTLHGLWPQYNTTDGYPADCTTEAFSQSAVDAVNGGESTMITYWPNVQEVEGTSTYSDFWAHEWGKHGTCSGLSQTAYYQNAINTLVAFGTPDIVTSNVGKTVAASDIRNAFGGQTFVALQCAGGNTLTGAFTCWNEESDLPTAQVQCRADVVNEDTCTASDITIPSLSSSSKGERGGF